MGNGGAARTTTASGYRAVTAAELRPPESSRAGIGAVARAIEALGGRVQAAGRSDSIIPAGRRC